MSWSCIFKEQGIGGVYLRPILRKIEIGITVISLYTSGLPHKARGRQRDTILVRSSYKIVVPMARTVDFVVSQRANLAFRMCSFLH